MDICDFLIKQGDLVPTRAQSIKTRAHRERLSLLRVILDEELVNPHVIFQRLVEKTQTLTIDLEEQEIDPDTLRLLPHEVAIARLLLPLSFVEPEPEEESPAGLRVAIADPFMEIDDISAATGYKLIPAIVDAVSLENAITKSYSSVITKVMTMEHPREAFSSENMSAISTQRFIDPSTVPSHSIEDEVSPSLKIQALVNLLSARGLLDRKAYIEELQRLLQEDHEL